MDHYGSKNPTEQRPTPVSAADLLQAKIDGFKQMVATLKDEQQWTVFSNRKYHDANKLTVEYYELQIKEATSAMEGLFQQSFGV